MDRPRQANMCLSKTSFDELGAASAMEQEYSVAEIESDISAAHHQRRRDATVNSTELPTSELWPDPTIDREGGTCFYRRRKKS